MNSFLRFLFYSCLYFDIVFKTVILNATENISSFWRDVNFRILEWMKENGYNNNIFIKILLFLEKIRIGSKKAIRKIIGAEIEKNNVVKVEEDVIDHIEDIDDPDVINELEKRGIVIIELKLDLE